MLLCYGSPNKLYGACSVKIKESSKTEPYRSPINIKILEQEEKAIHEAKTGKSEN